MHVDIYFINVNPSPFFLLFFFARTSLQNTFTNTFTYDPLTPARFGAWGQPIAGHVAIRKVFIKVFG